MNTSDHQPIALTKTEGEKFKAELKQAQIDCAINARKNILQDIANLDNILPILQEEDVCFDELTNELHNLISIAPEIQIHFVEHIKKLFILLPSDIKEQKDVSYIMSRLNTLEGLDLKIQTTDLSMYWSAYRNILYKYRIFDNKKQEKTQMRIHKEMLKQALSLGNKRTKGLKTAEYMLKRNGISVD